MKKKNIIISLSLWVFFVIYTLVVKYIDVLEIGPLNSQVGLGHFNNIFKEVIGYNSLFYKITNILGVIALLIALVYALVGLKELIERKSLLKVDREIIILGIFYILTGIIYLFFEKVIINYRPILIDNVLEASYPSSHTILSIFICGSAIILNNSLYKDKKWVSFLNVFNYLLLTLIIVGRIISGVHWITDIIGGIIVSCCLLFSYYTIVKKNS